MNKQKVTVAKYIEQQLALCGRSQKEVSEELGYGNPNIITMFKNGATKVPLNKIALLAKAVNVDPAYLLRMAMSEYTPEAWEAIEGILGKQSLLTNQDYTLVEFLHGATGDAPIDLGIEENRRILSDALGNIVSKDQSKADASVVRMNSMPKNARHK